jgi:hypothetical protein
MDTTTYVASDRVPRVRYVNPDLTVTERLRDQNNIGAWALCPDRGLKHQWKRTWVSESASEVTKLRADLDGYYTCQRLWCPGAKFGKS